MTETGSETGAEGMIGEATGAMAGPLGCRIASACFQCLLEHVKRSCVAPVAKEASICTGNMSRC